MAGLLIVLGVAALGGAVYWYNEIDDERQYQQAICDFAADARCDLDSLMPALVVGLLGVVLIALGVVLTRRTRVDVD